MPEMTTVTKDARGAADGARAANSPVVRAGDGRPIVSQSTRAALTREQVELVKRTVAKGATDDELALFLYQAQRTGLDPLSRQIHFIKRWSSDEQRMVGTVQTGIDGFRLIASRTGRYRPDDEAPRFEYLEGEDGEGTTRRRLFSATVKVFTYHDETQVWYPVPAIAYFDEYVQTLKGGQPAATWRKMPHVMLSKCAEALACRKAFPAELSGIYAFEEFGRTEADADRDDADPSGDERPAAESDDPNIKPVQPEQRKMIYTLWKGKHKLSEGRFKAWLAHEHKLDNTKHLTFEQAKSIILWLQGTETGIIQDFLRSIPETPDELEAKKAAEATGVSAARPDVSATPADASIAHQTSLAPDAPARGPRP